MRESKEGRFFGSFAVFSVLVITLLGFRGDIAAQELDFRPAWVKVPFCTTESVWTGEYDVVDYRTIEVPYLDYREVIVPGTGIWRIEIKKVPYTAYRHKVRWVNKIVSVVRTRWEPVRRVTYRVKTWFERTWLGKLIKKIKVRLEPVTQWVKKTVWDRVDVSGKFSWSPTRLIWIFPFRFGFRLERCGYPSRTTRRRRYP